MEIMNKSRARRIALLVLLILGTVFPSSAAVTSPEAFLGFKPGADRKLADWNQIVAYFQKLATETDRLRVTELGKTTMGKPFLEVVVSSQKNLANLAQYKAIEARLADPRRLNASEVSALVHEGKIIVGISCSIHSTEIGASQMSMQLAYELVTGQFPDAQEILDNVILVMFPSANPDGIQIVSDWYRQQLGTPYEGTYPPFLYQKYTGHDNNRDFFKLTQVETQMMNHALWKEWRPAIYWDVHQMGFYGPRLSSPPYSDPINPNVDPIIVRELFTLGGFMTGDLAIQGKPGVMTRDRFDAWWVGGNRITPWYHNSVGILTEAASARIATPIEVSPERLSGQGRGETLGGPVYGDTRNFLQKTFNFPDPWPGGTWRLGDIVNYEMSAAHGLLRAAAEQKDYFLHNFYQVTANTIREGEAGHPFAFVLPRAQRDEPTAVNLVNLLTAQGVEVYVATDRFGVEGKSFDAGSYIVPLNQPAGRLVKTLFEIQHYPDRRNQRDHSPERPYDVTGWTLPLMMGVEATTLNTPFKVPLSEVTQETPPPGSLTWLKSRTGKNGYLLEYRSNNAIVAMDRLLKMGYGISWLKKETTLDKHAFAPGTIYVTPPRKQIKQFEQEVQRLAQNLSLAAYTLPKKGSLDLLALKPPRVGVYKGWVPSTDEGWTRFELDKFEMPYHLLSDLDIRQGHLNDRYDVIILPQQSARAIVDGNAPRSYPDQYVGGIGDAGLTNLKLFVTRGGTLVAMDTATDLVTEKFGVPVRNALAGLKTTDFYCPGALLAAQADLSHPIAFGMTRDFTAMFDNSRAFDTTGGTVVARYRNGNPFQSGWLIGPKFIAGKAAIVDLPYGNGKIILLGFRTQFRGWTDGTFKLLFNSIFYGAATAITH